MKIRISNLCLSDRFNLFVIFIFLTINWISLATVQELGPPDFYEYYFYSQQVFSGDFSNSIIPPFFPILLGIMGGIIKLIPLDIDHFIIGGKIIALFSGLGVIYYAFRLLKVVVGKFAILGVVLISISPFFLNFLALPLTDMLFLLFFSMALFYFLDNRVNLSSLAVLLGIFTRIEGLLLFFSGIINFMKARLKNIVFLTIFSVVVFCNLIFLSIKYIPRIESYIDSLVSERFYQFFFLNLDKFTHVIYGNLLHFIPFNFPGFLKWLLFYGLIVMFFVGMYVLYRRKWQFASAVLIYMVLFIAAKGYVAYVGLAQIYTRRLLSFIFIFFLVSFIGFIYILKILLNNRKRYLKYVFLILAMISTFFIVIYWPLITLKCLAIFLIVITAIICFLKTMKLRKFDGLILFLIGFFLFGSIYQKSLSEASKFIKNKPNKAGYAIAIWINSKLKQKNDRVTVFSCIEMVNYYLKTPASIIHLNIRNKRQDEMEEEYLFEFLKKLKRNKIKYVAFDGYLPRISKPKEPSIKEILLRAQRRKEFFKVRKKLYYKGKNVGTILTPIFENIKKLKI